MATETVNVVIADFTGDSGSGGTSGLVPAPAAGDAAANKFLNAAGTWSTTPAPGTGDVVGPASAVDGNVALFNTTTGKLIKDGGTLGTAAFQPTSAFDTAGAAAAAQAASQPTGNYITALTGDVTASGPGSVAATIGNGKVTFAKMQAISNGVVLGSHPISGTGVVTEQSCTAAGFSLIAGANAAAQRTTLGLGTLATQSGTFSGTSSGTNTGDQTSVTGNAGTATALQTARNIDGQSFNGTADITVIAPGTHAATGKTTPVDNDELALVDSAASNVLKKLSWANVKATLKTYFDTLYQTIITFGTGVQTALGVNVGTAGSVVVNGGALGTPSSGTATNLTGTATGLTAGALSTEVITRITSDFSTSSTTLVDVTGGTAAMLANKDYIVEVDIIWQSSVITTGLWFSLNGPASPNIVVFAYCIAITATTQNIRNNTGYDSGTASADVPAANTSYYTKLIGIVRNGANAGNLQLRLAAENANAVSIRTGTRIKLTQTN